MNLDPLSLPFSFSFPDLPLSTIMWSVWGVAILGWLIVTGVFLYHWNTHAPGSRRVRRMKIVYFILSALLLISAATFIFSL